MKKEDLAKMIAQMVNDHWTSSQRPLLLSGLGAELARKGIDYKAILEGGSISSFIKYQDKLEIVQHPKQFARIGAIPAGQQYDFEKEDAPVSGPQQSDEYRERRRRRYAYYDFIRLLGELDLSEEELNGVVIPSSVVLKILEK